MLKAREGKKERKIGTCWAFQRYEALDYYHITEHRINFTNTMSTNLSRHNVRAHAIRDKWEREKKQLNLALIATWSAANVLLVNCWLCVFVVNVQMNERKKLFSPSLQRFCSLQSLETLWKYTLFSVQKACSNSLAQQKNIQKQYSRNVHVCVLICLVHRSYSCAHSLNVRILFVWMEYRQQSKY